ncbi:MAG: protein-arginine deiminase family protein [Pseudomonadota bacterium]
MRSPSATGRATLLCLLCLPALASRCDDKTPDSDDLTDTAAEAFWDTTEVLGVPNIDDDDENDVEDWDDGANGDDDDLATLDIPATVFDEVGGSMDLTLTGEGIRVWLDGAVLLDAEQPTATLGGAEACSLRVEFQDFLVSGSLGFEGGDRSHEVALLSSPLVLNHHLQAATHLFVISVSGPGYNNASMVADLQDILGSERVTVAPGTQFGEDVWVQDEIEFARARAPGLSLEVVIDSIRSQGGRYLDHFAEDYLQEPGVAIRTWGAGMANSLDSFGNLETAPPTTAGGVDYPLGRIYAGGSFDLHPNAVFWDFLGAQGVQAPFRPDSTWLCVGHVDEFTAFLPDPSAPRGFRLAVVDVGVAYDLLDALDPGLAIPKYTAVHGYSTVGELVSDDTLRAWNEDIQRDDIEPAIEVYMDAMGLDEGDLIRVPGIFEENAWCRNYALALIPGMVNLAVFTEADAPAKLLIADPFLRSSTMTQEEDPFLAAWDALMPQDSERYYLDDWSVYHEGWGEVHCGTNIRREPGADWWDSARHLLGGEE